MTDLTIDQVQEWITWDATPGGRAILKVTLKKDNIVSKHSIRTFRGRIDHEIPTARREALKDLNFLVAAIDRLDQEAVKEVAS